MSTKITVFFNNPDSLAAFQQACAPLLTRARPVLDVERLALSKVWPEEDGGPTPAYRKVDLHVFDHEDDREPVTTPGADASFTEAFALAVPEPCPRRSRTADRRAGTRPVNRTACTLLS